MGDFFNKNIIINKLVKLSLILFFALPVVSIVIKAIMSVEIAYILLDICYLALIAVVAGITATICTHKRAKNALGWLLFVLSFVSFFWSFEFVRYGNIFGDGFYKWLNLERLDKPSIQQSALYFVLLGMISVQFVASFFIVVKNKTKIDDSQVYKLPPRPFLIASLSSVCLVSLGLIAKLGIGLHSEEDIFYDIAYIVFCLVMWLFFWFVGMRLGRSSAVSKVNALWFVPIISVLFGLMAMLFPFAFWSFKFVYVLVIAVNVLVFGWYLANKIIFKDSSKS